MLKGNQEAIRGHQQAEHLMRGAISRSSNAIKRQSELISGS